MSSSHIATQRPPSGKATRPYGLKAWPILSALRERARTAPLRWRRSEQRSVFILNQCRVKLKEKALVRDCRRFEPGLRWYETNKHRTQSSCNSLHDSDTLAELCCTISLGLFRSVSKLFRILSRYLRSLSEIRKNLYGFHSYMRGHCSPL